MNYVGNDKIKLYDKLIEIDSGTTEWYFELAEVYEDLSNISSAIDTLELGLNNFEDDDTKIDFSEELIEIDETNAEWYLGLAQIYIDNNDRTSAISILKQGMNYVGDDKIKLYDKLIEIDSDTTGWYFELAEVYEDLSNTSSAIDTLELGLNNFEDDETKIDFSEELIEIDETNAEWYLTIAYIYISQGDTDAAIAILRQGLEKASDTMEIEELLNQLIPDTSELKTISKCYYDEDGKFSNSQEYEYDSDGNKVNCTLISDSKYTITYEYDEYDKIILIIQESEDGTFLCEIECEYNSHGNVSKRIYTYRYLNFDSSDTYWVDLDYEYDSNGNIIKKVESYSDDEYISVSDSNGNHPLGSQTTEYWYDENGLIVSYKVTNCSTDGTVISVWSYEYTYDESFNVISFVVTGDGVTTIYTYEYEYEYDSDGRVSKCTKTEYYADSGNICSIETLERIN